MRDFFSLDGPFNKYGGMLADTMILSLLWILFSIPIITIGAANTALFYVSTRRISEREGYITKDFFHAFRVNFVRATKLWLVVLIVALIAIFNLFNMGFLGNMSNILRPLQILILIQLSFISVYLYPLTARFDMGFRQSLKSCFYMANRHLLTSIVCTVMMGGLLFASLWFIPPLVLFVPGAYAMLSSHLIMRTFKKYRPEMDKDPILEVQELEAERAEERRLQAISYIPEDRANDTAANEFTQASEGDIPNDNELQ